MSQKFKSSQIVLNSSTAQKFKNLLPSQKFHKNSNYRTSHDHKESTSKSLRNFYNSNQQETQCGFDKAIKSIFSIIIAQRLVLILFHNPHEIAIHGLDCQQSMSDMGFMYETKKKEILLIIYSISYVYNLETEQKIVIFFFSANCFNF